MNKKMLIVVSIFVAVIFIIVSFNSVIGFQNNDSDTKKMSPFFKGIFEDKNSNYHLKNLDFDSKLFDFKIKFFMRLGHMLSISACVIKNNSMVWSKGYGFSDRALLKTPSKDTNYMIGSISKVITATAIMQLYENDSYDFELDDNVNKYLPFDFKNPNFNEVNITFRMLLAHQSSLHDHDSKNATRFLFSNKPYSYLQELLFLDGEHYLEDCWAEYSPGAEANYSNFAFILLGYLIERISGQTYEEYCQEHIFKPLKMENTSFIMSNIEKSNLAVPYIYLPGFYFRIPKSDFNFYDPCGGLYTTVEDLSHLLIAHLNGGIYEDVQILEESTIEMMHTVQYPESSPYFGNLRFGLGWFIIVDENDEAYRMGHGGDLICYHAIMLVDIKDNTSIIYFYNSGAYPIFMNLMNNAHKKITNLLFEKAREFQ